MSKRNYGWLFAVGVLGMALGSGCGPKETGQVVSAEQVTGKVGNAQYETADHWKIQGDLYGTAGASKGVVLFLHQRGGSADDWGPVALACQQAGYTAFAIDQRGTGRSTQGPGQTGESAPWDTSGDIDAGIYALKDKGAAVLVGASYGANNALIYAASHPKEVRGLVLLSPSTDYHGLKTLDAMKKYTGPVLIFHQKNDKIAGDGPALLDKASGSKDHTLKVSDGAGHGAALLNAETTPQIVEFVGRCLK